MKPKNLFMVVCIVCAVCVVGCESPQNTADNALQGRWVWISQEVGYQPEYVVVETPETTGECRTLVFDVTEWKYIVNDNLIAADTYSYSAVLQPDTLFWHNGDASYEIKVQWFSMDSIALDFIEGGGCQGPSVWVKVK